MIWMPGVFPGRVIIFGSFRIEHVAQAVEMPFTITVNVAPRKFRFAELSFKIVHHRMALLPSGRSDGASEDWRFDSVSRLSIRGVMQRAQLRALKSLDAFGSPRFGMGASEIQFALLRVNRLNTSITRLSRVDGVTFERGEFLRIFWR